MNGTAGSRNSVVEREAGLSCLESMPWRTGSDFSRPVSHLPAYTDGLAPPVQTSAGGKFGGSPRPRRQECLRTKCS